MNATSPRPNVGLATSPPTSNRPGAVSWLVLTILVLSLGWAIQLRRSRHQASVADDRPESVRPERPMAAPASRRPTRELPRQNQGNPDSQEETAASPTDTEQSRSRFESFWNRPGDFPEFSLIARQLRQAGVPEETLHVEVPVLYSALARYRDLETRAAEAQLRHWQVGEDGIIQLEPEPDEAGRQARRLVVEEAASALHEMQQRLVRISLDPESPNAQFLLSLRPKRPLPTDDGTSSPPEGPAADTASAPNSPGTRQ
jgi:hypothetical protein